MAQGMLDVLVKQAKVATSDARRFDAIKKELYGIEAHSRRQLLVAEKLQQRYKRFLAKHNRAYPPISLTALREFRTREGWPTFAIFSLHWPEFKMTATATGWSRVARGEVVFTPELPDAIANCYQDVAQNLLQRSQRVSGSVTLAAEFSGLIPGEVKDKIAEAEDIFKEIFVIAEPQRWSLTEPARIPADPLVVGWDGEGLYLIAEFDTTPVEEALMLEGPANKRRK
jgi:hypothetical protein